MNKKITALFLILLFNLIFAQFAGGTGSVEDPYQIATADQLNNVRNYRTSSFIQTADIDLGVPPWNEGEGWEPIGDYDYSNPNLSFRGNYNGNDYHILNMYIQNPGTSFLGLFGSSDGCFFSNIKIIDFNLEGYSYLGGLTGISYKDTITNCNTIGNIKGASNIGLLAGFFEGILLKNCHTVGGITSTFSMAGGLVADCSSIAINNCSSSITISSEGNYIGGLIAFCVETDIIDSCYSICKISSTGSKIGGLIGTLYDSKLVKNCFSRGSINATSPTSEKIGGFLCQVSGFDSTSVELVNCYSTVDLTGTDYVGGFSGKTYELASFENCYSTGQVTGNSNVGGFIGSIDSLNTVTVTNSYWDTETSGIDSSVAGEGRTTAEMTMPYGSNTYLDWDFSSVWRDDVINQNNGYPTFQWVSGIEENDDDFIAGEKGFELFQNYPNPFNPVTQIKFDLAKNAQVKLSVYNISGQKVAELVNGTKQAGLHTVDFDGSKLNSGVYYYTLVADGNSFTKKMVLTK